GTPGPWVVRASLPNMSGGVAIASDGTHIYANGGVSPPFIFHDETYRYDPAANTWEPLAPSPDGHYNTPAVYGNNGKIYVIGGAIEGSGCTVSDAKRTYDIATN